MMRAARMLPAVDRPDTVRIAVNRLQMDGHVVYSLLIYGGSPHKWIIDDTSRWYSTDQMLRFADTGIRPAGTPFARSERPCREADSPRPKPAPRVTRFGAPTDVAGSVLAQEVIKRVAPFGITPSRFGRKYLNNPSIIQDLRNVTYVSQYTLKRTRDALAKLARGEDA